MENYKLYERKKMDKCDESFVQEKKQQMKQGNK